MPATGTNPSELLTDINNIIGSKTQPNSITPTTHADLLNNIVKVLSGSTTVDGIVESINKQTTAHFHDVVTVIGIPVTETDLATLVVDNVNNHSRVMVTARFKLKLTTPGANLGTAKLFNEGLTQVIDEVFFQFSFTDVIDSEQYVVLTGIYENYVAGDRIRLRVAGSPNFSASFSNITAMTKLDNV